jgi:hypothetical protein
MFGGKKGGRSNRGVGSRIIGIGGTFEIIFPPIKALDLIALIPMTIARVIGIRIIDIYHFSLYSF